MYSNHDKALRYASESSASIQLKHVFDVHYALSQPTDFGSVGIGRRILFQTSGGVFVGRNIEGEVLAGGTDWTLTDENGVVRIDVNVTMRANNGDLIHGMWKGILRAKPEVLASIPIPDKRAEIDPSETYFRVTPVFETASADYAWLTQHQFLATAHFTRKGLSYQVMQVT